MIMQQRLLIGGIPAILWGEPSEKVFIHVHGKMSRKEYAQGFASLAEQEGWQTLSFDLAEHGERTDPGCPCCLRQGMKDLDIIAAHVAARWSRVGLYACSLGAWFALNTYAGRPLEKVLFQSPIVDMTWLAEHMLQWFGVTEQQLEAQKEIPTPIDVLRWEDYSYIHQHPLTAWHPDTRILYAALDDLQPEASIRSFAGRFGAQVTVAPGSRHPFMEPGDRDIVTEWIRTSLRS